MENPFKTIEERLLSIESIVRSIQLSKESEKNDSYSQLLTLKEACEFLNLKAPTVYSKCSNRELPYMKRGKFLYFQKDELISYLKKGKVKTNQEIEDEANVYLITNKSK